MDFFTTKTKSCNYHNILISMSYIKTQKTILNTNIQRQVVIYCDYGVNGDVNKRIHENLISFQVYI